MSTGQWETARVKCVLLELAGSRANITLVGDQAAPSLGTPLGGVESKSRMKAITGTKQNPKRVEDGVRLKQNVRGH